MIPLQRKLNCSASLKSPEKFDHSFLSNYTGQEHDKRIMEQTYDFNPSKMDENGSAVFFLPPFIYLSKVLLPMILSLVDKDNT